VFRPVYDKTRGKDGYVSIEVSPTLAKNTRGTIAMAEDLRDRTRRPNVMVKIPATKEGLPAIEDQIAKGHNINITLIFAVDRYDEVVEAYLSGLEKLQGKGGDLSKVASVASFFVSRVDTKVDKLLSEKIQAIADPAEKRELERLYGKAAIANSKVAYEHFNNLFSGARWEKLRKAGARTQRPLWASTSTKDPRYPDTYYVEELIGPDTVDTVPPATLAAFREHGEVRRSLDENVDLAKRQLKQLAEAGVDLDKVTQELETEGVESFTKSFESLLEALTKTSKDIKAGKGPRQWHSLGPLQPAVDTQIAKLQKDEAPRRLWAKDATLWSNDPAKRTEILDRLGWLNVAEKMLEHAAEFRELAKAGKSYTDVVLLGMGGSSLGPDVLRHTFGPAKGYPRLHVLDTTDPATILSTRRKIQIAKTLFIVASKSGETTETLSHFAYFWDQVSKVARGGKAGRQFAAITDPGTSLEKLAKAHDFRWIFSNPPDIGGRYSVLSYFGLVPGAFMGVNVAELLERATEMASSCADSVPADTNPGVWLGAVMGRLANMGRNKLTLIASPKVATFGYWVEQLLAESTGKEGKGIVPVEGEPLGRPPVYGTDRLFVYIRMDADAPNRAVSFCAGRSLLRSQARSWASTRSTSPTCRNPRTTQNACWRSSRAQASCLRRTRLRRRKREPVSRASSQRPSQKPTSRSWLTRAGPPRRRRPSQRSGRPCGTAAALRPLRDMGRDSFTRPASCTRADPRRVCSSRSCSRTRRTCRSRVSRSASRSSNKPSRWAISSR
jgi:transaldolase/glucose-6-phosphate isomerase